MDSACGLGTRIERLANTYGFAGTFTMMDVAVVLKIGLQTPDCTVWSLWLLS